MRSSEYGTSDSIKSRGQRELVHEGIVENVIAKLVEIAVEFEKLSVSGDLDALGESSL